MDEIELRARLSLDTAQAEKQLKGVANQASKTTEGIKLPKEVTGGLKELFKGDKGLDNLGKIARGAVNGINGVGGALAGAAHSAGAATAGVVGLVVALATMTIKLMQGTDTWELMTASLGELVDTVRQSLAPAISIIGEIVSDVARIFSAVLAPVLDLLGKAVRRLLLPIEVALKVLEPIAELLGSVLDLMMEAFSSPLSGMMESMLSTIVEMLDTAIKPAVEWVQRLTNRLKDFKLGIQQFITDLTGGLVRFDKAITSTLGTKNGTLKTSLDKWETSGTETASEKSARLAAEAAGRAADAAEATKQATIALHSGLPALKEAFKATGATVWGSVSEAGKAFWESMKVSAKAAFDSVGKAFESVGDKAAGVMNSIASAADSAFKKVTGMSPSDAMTAVKATNAAVWEAIKAVFGHIFGHANGGTISGESIWAMNESGNPEFMFSAGGRDTVVNGSILSEAVYRGVSMAMKDAGSTQRIEVGVKESAPAGPRELAQWLLPSLKFAMGGSRI